jgi:hypothetical protein
MRATASSPSRSASVRATRSVRRPDLDLRVDGAPLDAFESDRRDPREHRRIPVQI